jgi:hypothetical protein
VHDLVERESGLAIVAERLLDDDPRPSGVAPQPMLGDGFDDWFVSRWRSREVEEPVRVGAEREVELVERAPEVFVSGIVRRRDEMEMLGEAAPDLLVEWLRSAVLRDRTVQLLAVLLVAQRLPPRSDDGERRREQPLVRKVVERRDELALREIARSAEDDDRRRLGDAREPEPLA